MPEGEVTALKDNGLESHSQGESEKNIWGAISREQNWALCKKQSPLLEQRILATNCHTYFKIAMD